MHYQQFFSQFFLNTHPVNQVIHKHVEKSVNYLKISFSACDYPQFPVDIFNFLWIFPQFHTLVGNFHTPLCKLWTKFFTACGKLF